MVLVGVPNSFVTTLDVPWGEDDESQRVKVVWHTRTRKKTGAPGEYIAFLSTS